ncbi:hypothetical protein C2G38_2225950 [Gigaspora rosea]|uniref:Major facilitator superfamily domain-containing protein n=1 Tax=Gigaspora rosea TaxID=44941 RepID=A0A397TYQ5_9GLOM|nr:hypothetical protein C2G38_2225950 [Gigaspora rosea]
MDIDMDIDDDHKSLEIVVEQNYSINKERTPLPWSILFILGLILISEPINYSILLSFVYFMVKDFKITDDDKEIGKYAGLIRNVGVAKSMLAEVTDKTNQKEAFSLPGLCWSFGLLGFHTVSFDEIYAIYSVTDIMSGGLGFSDIKLSLTLNSVGILNLIANFVIYPLATNKENLEKVYKLGRFLYIPAYLLFPLINRLAITLSPSDNGVLIFTIFALAIKQTLNLQNSTPNYIIGTANGVAQTLSAFAHAIGPAIHGSLWSWSLSNNLSFPFNNYFVFISLSLIALSGGLQSLLISFASVT